MDHLAILAFVRTHRWAIEATASLTHAPQAAIIGFAATEELALVIDTLASSRKAANGRANPRVALVIAGWNDNEPRTIQYEGVVDFPVGTEPERHKQMYFAVFPDGVNRR